MKKNSTSSIPAFFYAVMLISLFLLMNTGCNQIPEDLTPYDPGTAPVPIGTYEIKEDNGILITSYEMILHWHKGFQEFQIEFCNFANRKISVVANVFDGTTITLPQQKFETEFENFQVLQGTGYDNVKRICARVLGLG